LRASSPSLLVRDAGHRTDQPATTGPRNNPALNKSAPGGLTLIAQ
jgi:hypothetical protein